MTEWNGKLSRIQAIKIIDSITDQDDPYWENHVEDYYDEDSDTMPSIYHVFSALGVTEQEYKDATGAGNVNWPCCGSVTETESWEPERCPFCHKSEMDAALAAERERCAKLAAWLQWCLDNCDDSPEWNFGTIATEHIRALLAGGDAPMPDA